jgi:hypothetical protein
VPESATELYKAAYNYLFVRLDGSRGLHNLPYTIQLLQQTIRALDGPDEPHAWSVYRPKG